MAEEYMTDDFKQWPVERKKLTDLQPADYNPRIISSGAKAGLGASLKKFGLVQPIVWNKRSGRIVGGHQRVRVLMEQGADEADVTVVDLSDNEEVALNIALNNVEIQGDFTEKAIDVLDDASSELGEKFGELKLSDLKHELESRFRETDKVHKMPKPQGVRKKKNKEVIPDNRIIIECPKCGANFRKSDKKVLV